MCWLQMQIYSRQLEERLEELSDKVSNQKDKQTEILQREYYYQFILTPKLCL